MIKLGVLADTHVPDRSRRLDPRISQIFRSANVQAILHAGDVCTRAVLDQLGQVAPVHAVRGNRDLYALGRLPKDRQLIFGGVRITLTHGHGPLLRYIIDRVDYILRGYRTELFQPRLLAEYPDAQVIVFGHTHRPYNHLVNGCLLFNPGSPHCPEGKGNTPSIGLLTIEAGGEVYGELVSLDSQVAIKPA